MFRHDPRALLYAPLRVLESSDPDDNAVFSIDQPGLALDRKVANLLRVIGVDAGQAFGS
jgi:hypothetical protein